MNEDELEKIYRPSATLIIAAKINNNEQGYNYQVNTFNLKYLPKNVNKYFIFIC